MKVVRTVWLAGAAVLAGPAAAGTGNLPCGAGAVCRTLVPVHATPSGCEVRWPLQSLEVAKGTQPRLVWRLVKANIADPARYLFDGERGIALTDNNLQRDLDRPGHEAADRSTFRWRSLNRRARDIAFDFVVYRTEADGSRTRCTAADPTIVNRGP